MVPGRQERFISFLTEDLGIPTDAIQLALAQDAQTSGFLPMILWQYGLVTINQLDQIFDWLEQCI